MIHSDLWLIYSYLQIIYIDSSVIHEWFVSDLWLIHRFLK